MRPHPLITILAATLVAIGPRWQIPAVADVLSDTETNRLVAALAVIAPAMTGIMDRSNLGILLEDAACKDAAAGGRCRSAIPLYERVARALTNSYVHPSTN